MNPLLSGDQVKVARREMEDAAFMRDRLHEARAKLAERVEALKALEADRRLQAEHVRISAERDRLAEEMERMADPIVKIASTVSRIAACDCPNCWRRRHERAGELGKPVRIFDLAVEMRRSDGAE
jgi:hypothetical protein